MLLESATLEAILGLFVGKPIGITAASWLAVRTGLAELPAGVRFTHVLGAGMLGGIGFTMALFIGGLAFPGEAYAALFTQAKVGVLLASLISASFGLFFLSRLEPVAEGEEEQRGLGPAPRALRDRGAHGLLGRGPDPRRAG